MSLKDRVIKAMEHKKCDIPTLAAAAKVRDPSVHGWVNGSSMSMRAGPAIRAAAFLGVNPLWLAEGDGEMLSGLIYSIAAPSQPRACDSATPQYHHRELVSRIASIAETISDDGLKKAIGYMECLAGEYPLAKAKRA